MDINAAYERRDQALKRLNHQKSGFVERVISKYLGRPATIEDAKNFRMEHIEDGFVLFYNNNCIGKIVSEMDLTNFSGSIKFIPN